LANTLFDEVGISASQIGRILAAMDLKPHRVRYWISRRDDPYFWERAADVCGLWCWLRALDTDLGLFSSTRDNQRCPGLQVTGRRRRRPAPRSRVVPAADQ